jgi:hypothetical protein
LDTPAVGPQSVLDNWPGLRERVLSGRGEVSAEQPASDVWLAAADDERLADLEQRSPPELALPPITIDRDGNLRFGEGDDAPALALPPVTVDQNGNLHFEAPGHTAPALFAPLPRVQVDEEGHASLAGPSDDDHGWLVGLLPSRGGGGWPAASELPRSDLLVPLNWLDVDDKGRLCIEPAGPLGPVLLVSPALLIALAWHRVDATAGAEVWGPGAERGPSRVLPPEPLFFPLVAGLEDATTPWLEDWWRGVVEAIAALETVDGWITSPFHWPLKEDETRSEARDQIQFLTRAAKRRLFEKLKKRAAELRGRAEELRDEGKPDAARRREDQAKAFDQAADEVHAQRDAPRLLPNS